MMHVLQWNINGYRTHLAELRLLIQDRPICVCLQETHFKPSDTPSLCGYAVYRKDDVGGDRARGGVAVFMRDCYHSVAVPLTTSLQAVAATLHTPVRMTVCSLYLPPGVVVRREALTDLIDQLPRPFLLLGDFNAHHALWGSNSICPRGRLVESILLSHNICLLNRGQHTHFSTASGTTSAIDLSLCSPSLVSTAQWAVGMDLHSSDHFPVWIHLPNGTVPEPGPSRWVLRKADWPLYSQLVEFEPQNDIEAMVDHITSVIHCAAAASIPQSSGQPRRQPVPWWNNDCRSAIRDRRKALRRFRCRPSTENLEAFRIARARARRIIKESKRKSWREFLQSINRTTPSAQVWESIRRISGKGKFLHLNAILRNGVITNEPSEIGQTLAEYFFHVTQTVHQPPAFSQRRKELERGVLAFQSSNSEVYNSLFSLWELDSALSAAGDTAPGADGIHYAMLRHLPPESKEILLSLFNSIWIDGYYPKSWREAILIPLLKPGKDRLSPSSYRSIALTSCLGKTLERMINRRLVWVLETNKFLSPLQCGFRRYCSTLDNMTQLEAAIQDAFLRKQHLVGVFFDLDKAYDTTWRYNILKQLHDWGFRGRLPLLLRSFLSERFYRYRVGNTLSNRFTQENGVPQGSVLSVTLFAIAINGITSTVRAPVKSSLFVDDFAIFCSSSSLVGLARQLQLTLGRLEEWANATGFRFSAEKTVCVHFHRSRGLFASPDLRFGGTSLRFHDSVRFLGLIFDERLTWLSHLKDLKARSLKKLDILKCLCGTTWGADRACLLQFYRAFVRSQLDYGCTIYGSARKSYIRMLDSVHHAGIRLATGAYRTSPIPSLCAEAGEPPLNTRRQMLMIRQCYSHLSVPHSPAFSLVSQPPFERLYHNRPRATQPFGIRAKRQLADFGVCGFQVLGRGWSKHPPWQLMRPPLILDMVGSGNNPFSLQSIFSSILEQHRHCTVVYTDGSKRGDTLGCSVVYPDRSYKYRLPAEFTVYDAELYAVQKALERMGGQDGGQLLICSDSLSGLQAIQQLYPAERMVQIIQDTIYCLQRQGNQVSFCWVPGHVGIRGNEKADAAAKEACNLTSVERCAVPLHAVHSMLKQVVMGEWEREWLEVRDNKLRLLKPTTRPWRSSFQPLRSHQVALTRLRIGHCPMTHGFLLRGEDPPVCGACGVLLSIRHILLECVLYDDHRQLLAFPRDLPSLLTDSDTSVTAILNFCLTCNLFPGLLRYC